MITMIKVLMFIQWLMGRLAGLSARLAPARFAPIMEWHAPKGPYQAGFCDNELTLPNGTRSLLRTWYPAVAPADARRAPYLSDNEIGTMIAGMGRALTFSPFLVRRMGMTMTHSVTEARPANADVRFPVLVFSHGFSGTVNQNTALCEHLASHGYIVISVAHPSGAAAVHYTDNTSAVMSPDDKNKMLNPDLIKAALGIKRAKSLAERRDAIADYAVIEPMKGENDHWAENLRAVVEALQTPNTLPASLAAILSVGDLERLALIGHSFGGAASAAAAHNNPHVRAVVNLDGGQFGLDLYDRTISVPLLMLYSETATFDENSAFNDFHYENHASAGESGQVRRFFVRGANHLDYTDLTLFGRGMVKVALGRGRYDGQPMLDTVANLVTAFLDHQLKQAPDCLTEAAAKESAVREQDMSAVRELSQ